MGLDIVEIVMRCEENFGITIKDEDAEQMHTVGDLYRQVCRGVGVASVADPGVVAGLVRPSVNPGRPDRGRWTSADVWATVKWVVLDQLQVREDEVTPWADFQRDLGAD
jgi:acyl carrier protein